MSTAQTHMTTHEDRVEAVRAMEQQFQEEHEAAAAAVGAVNDDVREDEEEDRDDEHTDNAPLLPGNTQQNTTCSIL